MDSRGYQQYQQQTVNTITQEELLLLLYDGLVKYLLRCDLALTRQDYALLDQSADRCIQMLRYLDDTLDRRYPISNELHKLYDYFGYELNRVKIGRNKERLDIIRPMISDLRDSFRAASKNTAAMNHGEMHEAAKRQEGTSQHDATT